MRRLGTAALVLTLCFATATAAAGEVCLLDDDNAVLYRFGKLKAPKGPNAAAPVVGVAIGPGISPVNGVVTRDDEVLVLGLTRYGDSCLVSGVLGADGNGSFSYDCNLDGAVDESVAIEALDCASL